MTKNARFWQDRMDYWKKRRSVMPDQDNILICSVYEMMARAQLEIAEAVEKVKARK